MTCSDCHGARAVRDDFTGGYALRMLRHRRWNDVRRPGVSRRSPSYPRSHCR